jgi:hypothetical protein
MNKILQQYSCHRLNWTLFKVLLGLNLSALKFLLVVAQIVHAVH